MAKRKLVVGINRHPASDVVDSTGFLFRTMHDALVKHYTIRRLPIYYHYKRFQQDETLCRKITREYMDGCDAMGMIIKIR